MRHSETPRSEKLLLGLVICRLLLPFDLRLDFVPVIGQLDDVIIVCALVIMAAKMIPEEVIERSYRISNTVGRERTANREVCYKSRRPSRSQ
ncbi:DUF1232 domain-containing protein [SAR202 cluster bacterium AC-647-N09_OGT_505m]|nr:DUF1232 domain-containing protein [SAR202 cluster bacterium AC-647-N09_OGT_505m]